MMVIGVTALLIIGPKDLPKVFKQVTLWVRYVRGMANEFRSGVDDMVRDADLEDAKKMFDTASELSPKNQFKSLIDPNDDISKGLDMESDSGLGFDTPSKELFEELTASTPEIEESSPTKKTTAKKPAVKKAASTKAAPKKKTPAKTTAKKPASKVATKPAKPKP